MLQLHYEAVDSTPVMNRRLRQETLEIVSGDNATLSKALAILAFRGRLQDWENQKINF